MNEQRVLRASAPITAMAAQMFLQMVGLRETLFADLTGERSLTSVSAHVLCEVAAVSKLVVADDAGVAFLAGVRDHVTLERRRVDEGLGTDRANVRTLPGVCPHVFLQQVRPCVLLATDLTSEWPLPCVDQHVSSEHVRLVELHAALRARVVLVLGVVPLVFIQALHVLELLAADVACVRTVDMHVALQDRRLAELHRTLLARIHWLPVLVLDQLCVPQ